ncbi:MAG: hypothetical protein ACFCVE_14990 [Phycisphaerae bacterium]
MHDVEFLPAWYPRLMRRRRAVVFQAWLAAGLACGLCVWVLVSKQSVMADRATLQDLDRQITGTQVLLDQLRAARAVRDELNVKDQLLADLGVPVEVNRLVTEVALSMPGSVSLLEFEVQSTEQRQEPVGASRWTRQARQKAVPAVNRRIAVRLKGIAPGDVEVTEVFSNLSRVPFFEQVRMNYGRDRHDRDRILREFEITFWLNANHVPVAAG